MNELQVFENELFGEVRTVNINGEVWFVLIDICKALKLTNPSVVASRLDEDEVTKFDLGGLSGLSNMTNESGLYKVLFRSDKEEAKIFTKWVTKEVIPSVRKHGVYMTDEKIEEALTDPDMIIKLATNLKLEREKRKKLEGEITQNRPKIIYYDEILESRDSKTTTELAQEFGMTAYKLNKHLVNLGIQYYSRGKFFITGAFVSKGYHDIRKYPFTDKDGNRRVNEYMVWTQKGKQFIYELLKENFMIG